MEEEKETIAKSKQQSFISKEKLRTLLSQVQRFSCIKNNKTLYVCAEETCQKPAFICIVQDCQCKQIHLNYRLILLKRIINSIFSKTKETPPEAKQSYQLLYDKINQMIDDLSQLRSILEGEEEFFGLIYWCLDNIYQGQTQINQNLKDKPVYAYIDIYRTNTVYEFKGVQYEQVKGFAIKESCNDLYLHFKFMNQKATFVKTSKLNHQNKKMIINQN